MNQEEKLKNAILYFSRQSGEKICEPNELGYVKIIIRGMKKDLFHYSLGYKKEVGYYISLYINKSCEKVRANLIDKLNKQKLSIFDKKWLNNRDGYSGRFYIDLGECDAKSVAQVFRMFINYTKDDLIREINLIKK